jgi:hypothetical protein
VREKGTDAKMALLRRRHADEAKAKAKAKARAK